MGGRTLHFYFPSAQLQISSPEPCGNNNSICFKDFSNFDLNNCLAGKVKLNFLLCKIYIYTWDLLLTMLFLLLQGLCVGPMARLAAIKRAEIVESEAD